MENTLGKNLEEIAALSAQSRESGSKLRAAIRSIEERLCTLTFDYWHTGSFKLNGVEYELGFERVEAETVRAFHLRVRQFDMASPWEPSLRPVGLLTDQGPHLVAPAAKLIPKLVEGILETVRLTSADAVEMVEALHAVDAQLEASGIGDPPKKKRGRPKKNPDHPRDNHHPVG